MKLPKYIKDKIDKVSILSSKVIRLSSEIEKWFSDNDYNTELLRTGCGGSLEDMEYGQGVDFEKIETLMKEQDEERADILKESKNER